MLLSNFALVCVLICITGKVHGTKRNRMEDGVYFSVSHVYMDTEVAVLRMCVHTNICLHYRKRRGCFYYVRYVVV